MKNSINNNNGTTTNENTTVFTIRAMKKYVSIVDANGVEVIRGYFSASTIDAYITRDYAAIFTAYDAATYRDGDATTRVKDGKADKFTRVVDKRLKLDRDAIKNGATITDALVQYTAKRLQYALDNDVLTADNGATVNA